MNDWRERERADAFSRLEGLIQRHTDPAAWHQTAGKEASALAERWKKLGDAKGPDFVRLLVRTYRLICRVCVWRASKEYFFRLLAMHLSLEAHVGPQAVVRRKEFLGPLWDRLKAIRVRHGWPETDEDGDPWTPEGHVKKLPKDYVAWSADFDRVAGQMERDAFRAVCLTYNVPEMADLREQEPAEYQRRMDVGREYEREAHKGASRPPVELPE